MKLSTITESQTAYHITDIKNIALVRSQGLRKSQETKYDHVGDGIYLFFDKNEADNMADYIGIYEPALVTITIDYDDLLMDEDALIVQELSDKENLKRILPKEAYQEYLQFMKEMNGDELPIENPDTAAFKTRFIDKYQIKPHPLFKTEWGHHSVLTARLPKDATVIDIEEMDY